MLFLQINKDEESAKKVKSRKLLSSAINFNEYIHIEFCICISFHLCTFTFVSSPSEFTGSMQRDTFYQDHYSEYYDNRYRSNSVIIVYDPPQINVVPSYSRTMVANVDPNEYYNEYMDSLLDTSALLDWCKRLGIPDHVVSRCKADKTKFLKFISVRSPFQHRWIMHRKENVVLIKIGTLIFR